jgi:cysteine-rich repeat protein
LSNGRCLINGICRQEGEADPENGCRECMTAASKNAWSNDDTNTCDDGNVCLDGETCSNGECVSGDDALTCDDGNPCTQDTCDPEDGCVAENAPGPCADGNPCTENDSCLEGSCAGTPVVCDDGNPCTEDSCDPATGCTAANVGWECDDGNVCTVGDLCVGGVCSAGQYALGCDDGNPCTADGCSPENGCLHPPVEGPCEDGDLCNEGDFCQEGTCQPGSEPVDCDDNNVCTLDTCDPGTGCGHSPMPGDCDDGSVCTVGDTCSQGTCVPGITVVDCSDDSPCTVDTCDPLAGCKHTQSDGPCNDGNECTVGEQCVDGSCVGDLKVCDDDNPCTTDTCNPLAAGGCVFTPNDQSCDDGDPCTLGDTCMDGECASGLGELPCDDGNACTDDSCAAGVGCKHKAKVALCDDANPCTQGDYCANGQCISGANICKCAANADCAPNDDADWCNGWLYCDTSPGNPSQWSCKVNPTTVVTCSTAGDTECAGNQCIPATGKCQMQAMNEALPCDDGNGCTVGDKCAQGVCTGTTCAALGKYCVQGVCSDKPCFSLAMDGTDDHLSVPAGVPPALQGSATKYVEMWIYPTADNIGLFHFGDNTGCGGCTFRLYANGGNLGLDVSAVNGFSSIKPKLNHWNFVFAYWDKSAGAYYVGMVDGGQIVAQKLNLPASQVSGGAWWIGRATEAWWTHWFKGRIGLVRVWTRIPTSAEILANMWKQLPQGTDPDLVAQWAFDEGAGTAVGDSAGKGYGGQATGGATWYPDSPLCGSCPQCECGETCQLDTCVFTACEGKECGTDGCGGTCGTCDDGNACTTDACTAGKCAHAPIPGCCGVGSGCDDANSCTADSCGPLGCVHEPKALCCGNGIVESGEKCDDGNQSGGDVCYSACQQCQPSCANKSCGPNGCGGDCGTCNTGLDPQTGKATIGCVDHQCKNWCGQSLPLGFPLAGCTNLAPASVHTASSSATPPSAAADLDRCTSWNAGGSPQQWWMADFGTPHPINGVTVVVEMAPYGNSTHVIETSNNGVDFATTYTVSQYLVDQYEYSFLFVTPVTARYLRVKTTTSPSWVAWWEVGIFSCP